MQLEEFWQLIEKSHKKKPKLHLQQYAMVGRLSRMSTDDIIDFYHIFKQLIRHAELNSLTMAALIIGNGIGSDGFYDFRGWLIAQGKDIYCTAIQNPEILVDFISRENRQEIKYEGFNYVGAFAYQIKIGEELEVFDLLENAMNRDRIQPSLDEISKYPRDMNNYYDKEEAEVLPKLWEKFGKDV